jgi:hypothetical protein
MSTKTSPGAPRVIILATLVVVLATSVEVVPYVGVGRCDGHHKWSDCIGHASGKLAAVVSMSKSLAQTNKSSARRPEQLGRKTEKQVPKGRLSQEKAKRLVAKSEAS